MSIASGLYIRTMLAGMTVAGLASCEDGPLEHGRDHARGAPLAQAGSDDPPAADAGAPRQRPRHTPPLTPRAPQVTLPGSDVSIATRGRASGSACGDELSTTLSEDGSELVAEYWSLNEIEMASSKSRMVGFCHGQVVLETSAPMSYAVTNAWAQGFTDLDASVSATVQFTYAHPGRTLTTLERAFAPSENEDFRIEQGARTGELAWSPCSRRSVVSLQTRFTITNGIPAGRGAVDMCATAVGGMYSHAAFKLAWRACDPETEAAAPAP